MEIILQRVLAPIFLIVGVSHVLHPYRWADFFMRLKQTGQAAFVIAILTMPLGMLIVVGHNRWEWDWPLFLTLAGWGMTVKSAVYLLWPQLTEWVIRKGCEERSNGFRVAGLLMAFFGGVLSWKAFAS